MFIREAWTIVSDAIKRAFINADFDWWFIENCVNSFRWTGLGFPGPQIFQFVRHFICFFIGHNSSNNENELYSPTGFEIFLEF